MMPTFETIAQARDAIMVYRFGAMTLESTEVQTKITAMSISPSPVDQIVRMGEFLYSQRATLVDDASKSLAGGLIAFATMNAWYGLLEDNRGNRIVQAIRRELGEEPPVGMEWPDPSTDPANSTLLL